jgi:hypothetical protein
MVGAVATGSPLLSASGGRFGNLAESFARLEKDSNGRLGVAVLDTGSGDSEGHPSDFLWPSHGEARKDAEARTYQPVSAFRAVILGFLATFSRRRQLRRF